MKYAEIQLYQEKRGGGQPLKLSTKGFCAFTLTEVLVAVVIVGVIAALVLPSVVSHYQEKSFDQAFQRETQAIQSAVGGLTVNENKASFFETMMYTIEEPTSYTDSAEKFIKTYLRPSKLCGDNNGDCFATRYYEYKDNDKKVYTPTYKGSCAKLKNGASICLTPQIGAQPIEGIIDINGEKAPNVLNKDLRTFTLNVQTQAGRDTEIAAVLDTPFNPLETDEGDPCEGMTCGCGDLPSCPPECSSNQNDWDLTCCQYNSSSITSNSHHCCTYESMKSSLEICKSKTQVKFTMQAGHYGYADSKYIIWASTTLPQNVTVTFNHTLNGNYLKNKCYSITGSNSKYFYSLSCTINAGNKFCYVGIDGHEYYDKEPWFLQGICGMNATPVIDGYEYTYNNTYSTTSAQPW